MSKQARRNGKAEPKLRVFPQVSSQDEDKMADADTTEFAPIELQDAEPQDVEPEEVKAQEPEPGDIGDDWCKSVTKTLEETASVVKEVTNLMKEGFGQLQEHDHRITDHDFRIKDLEKRMGLIEWCDEGAKARAAADVAEPKLDPSPKPEPVLKVEPKVEPVRVEPVSKSPIERAIPAQMYEFWDHKRKAWLGPLMSISAAKQAAGGIDSGVRIVYMWFDPESGKPLSKMSSNDILRYCPR